MQEIYRTYNSDLEKHVWEKQDNQELLNAITSKLRLTNIDVFERVANDL